MDGWRKGLRLINMWQEESCQASQRGGKKTESLTFCQMRCKVPPQFAYSDKLWVTLLIKRLNIPSGWMIDALLSVSSKEIEYKVAALTTNEWKVGFWDWGVSVGWLILTVGKCLDTRSWQDEDCWRKNQLWKRKSWIILGHNHSDIMVMKSPYSSALTLVRNGHVLLASQPLPPAWPCVNATPSWRQMAPGCSFGERWYGWSA